MGKDGGINLDLSGVVVAGANTIFSAIGGLFKSKKHYHLYYWNTTTSSWVFVMDGHPDKVKKAQAGYIQSGVQTAVVRNEGDKHADGTLAPKSPPAGYAPTAGGLNPWILAGIAGAAVLGFVLLRKKRSRIA